jgi:hypothetical protein
LRIGGLPVARLRQLPITAEIWPPSSAAIRNCAKTWLCVSGQAAFTLSFIGTEWAWALFGQSLPQAAQRSAFGGCCGGEKRLSQNVVMGLTGGLQRAITTIGQHCEPSPPVCGVDFSTDQAAPFETRHEMRRTSRAQEYAISKVRHAESAVRGIEQRDQHVELRDRESMDTAETGIEVLEHQAVEQHQRTPCLPFFRLEELVIGT